MVLRSWEHAQRIEHRTLTRAEAPLAQFQALFCNANRDPKSKAFTAEEFRIYRPPASRDTQITAPTAAALLSLHQDARLHPLLYACWAEALHAATDTAPAPPLRALVSDDNAVWLVAPVWEGENARGLVCVAEALWGAVVLRDIDKPLITYRFEIPRRAGAAAGWIAAGHLLVRAT